MNTSGQRGLFMKRKKVLFLTLLVAFSLFFLLEKSIIPGFSSKPPFHKSFELIGKVIQLIQNDYVEEASPDKIMKGAYKGLVDSLDTLSCYLDKNSVLRYRQSKEANLKDIGLILFKIYGSFPQVVGIIENSPSEKKGVQLGDIISAIDGQSTLTMSLTETYFYLKDKDEIPLTLRILRGDKTLEIEIERTQLFHESFSYSPLKSTSGILTIHQFYPPCTSIIKEKILPRLMKEKKILIIDLRNCYEGDIEETRKFINIFLKAQRIGYLKMRDGNNKVLSCPDNAELEMLPVGIWTNQATIGPAEAVAGVLQEFKRAKIIGLSTLGLVAEQNFFPLGDGTGLLLTSGIFHLNSGKKLWENGIKPDTKIKNNNQDFSTYLKKSLSSP